MVSGLKTDFEVKEILYTKYRWYISEKMIDILVTYTLFGRDPLIFTDLNMVHSFFGLRVHTLKRRRKKVLLYP